VVTLYYRRGTTEIIESATITAMERLTEIAQKHIKYNKRVAKRKALKRK